MASFWLQVREPGQSARVFTIEGRLEIGRDCDGLELDDPTVSRRHLWVEPTPQGLLLVDLGSANGTYVDGARVEAPCTLQAGQTIRLGESELVVHQAHDVQKADGTAAEIDPTLRPSEGLRSLSSASAHTQRGSAAAAAQRAREEALEAERAARQAKKG